ncbi:MAG TPA: hypothetical protein VKP14_09145 [Gaiellaceae bacterium]|nr:hypothetical protein [Gaiellaceae bacterium]
MSADVAHELQRETETKERVGMRVRVVLALGPLTSLAGIVWAVAQPWRLTLLHPSGQGFWWLFSEPPLYVVLVGLLFRFVIAPGIVADLEAER